LGVQRKLRVVSLPATWFQIDAANLRGHLDMMMPNFNCFDHSFPPIDLNSGSSSAPAVVRRLTAGCGGIVVLPWREVSIKNRMGAIGCLPHWSCHESKRSPGGGLTLARQNYLSGIRFIQRPIPLGSPREIGGAEVLAPPPLVFHGANKRPRSGSNYAEQKEDDQNNDHQAQTAARIIAPIPAVRPGRECANQHQNEQNEQNSSY
jgi:hypothetical protein